MACDCEIHVCLEPVRNFDNCPEVLTVQLGSPLTGTLDWEFEFNGKWRGGTIDVAINENIVLPFVFNEDYIHTVKFYNGNELINDTCYKLDTSKIAGSYTQPSDEGGGLSSMNITLTEEMLSEDEEGRQVVTISDLEGYTLVLIADGNQIYNNGSFTQNGDSWTYTNGAVNYAGQKITLLVQ